MVIQTQLAAVIIAQRHPVHAKDAILHLLGHLLDLLLDLLLDHLLDQHLLPLELVQMDTLCVTVIVRQAILYMGLLLVTAKITNHCLQVSNQYAVVDQKDLILGVQGKAHPLQQIQSVQIRQLVVLQLHRVITISLV